MRVHLPQFDPHTPALAHTQVGSMSVLVANPSILAPQVVPEHAVDAAAQRALLAAFGSESGAQGRSYEHLYPAYALGWRTAVENPAANWEVLERHLPAYWESQSASVHMTWHQALAAVHAGWALAKAQTLDDEQQVAQLNQIDALAALLNPLIRECTALSSDVQALLGLGMLPFPYQVLQRHARTLEGCAQELQWLANGVQVSRPQRLGWWLRQRSTWLRLQGQVADWTYQDVMLLCEQREQQLLGSYRSASTNPLSQIVRQVLLLQQHDLQRNMEKLRWVRSHWVG